MFTHKKKTHTEMEQTINFDSLLPLESKQPEVTSELHSY